MAGLPLDGGCGKCGKEAIKDKTRLSEDSKNYKPSAKVMAMTCGPLPKDFDLDKELDEMWEERAR